MSIDRLRSCSWRGNVSERSGSVKESMLRIVQEIYILLIRIWPSLKGAGGSVRLRLCTS